MTKKRTINVFLDNYALCVTVGNNSASIWLSITLFELY